MDLQQDTNPVTEEPAIEPTTVFSFGAFREQYPGSPGNMLAGMSEGLHDEQPAFLQDLTYVIQDEKDIPLYSDVTRIMKVGLQSKALVARGVTKPVMEITFVSTSRDRGVGVWKTLQARRASAQVVRTRLQHYNSKFFPVLSDMNWPGMPLALLDFLHSREKYLVSGCLRGKETPAGRGFVIDLIRDYPAEWDHVNIYLDFETLLTEEASRRYHKLLGR